MPDRMWARTQLIGHRQLRSLPSLMLHARDEVTTRGHTGNLETVLSDMIRPIVPTWVSASQGEGLQVLDRVYAPVQEADYDPAVIRANLNPV